MLYYLVKPLARWSMYGFCRHIYIHNLEVLDNDKPTLIACNHPTAFFDPCLVAAVSAPVIHFVVRGDFFKLPVLRNMMYSLKLIPIHRSQHATYSQMRENLSLMDSMMYKLHENINLMVMVEGSGSINRQLRPLRKGIARLAFGTYEKYGRDDLQIVPMGVNFDDPTQFRLTPMIAFGEAIPLKNYLATYQINKNRAIRQLMQDIEQGMRAHIIHVEATTDFELYNQLAMLHWNSRPTTIFPIRRHSRTLLNQLLQLAATINSMSSEQKQAIHQALDNYQNQLTKFYLDDRALTLQRKPSALFLLLGCLPAIVGWAGNIIPIALGRYLANRKVKRIQYYIPVAWAAMLLLYLLYAMCLLPLLLWLLEWSGVLLWLTLPFLGYTYILWREQLERWQLYTKQQQVDKTTRSELIIMRQNLMKIAALEVEMN